MGILYEQNYNAQAENVREGFIPENLPTVQHVQINFGLKHRSLTNEGTTVVYMYNVRTDTLSGCVVVLL